MGQIIKLGAVGALKNYVLKSQGEDGIAWSRGPAQPFAGKVNTANLYDRIDIWNEWVQEDWQQGVGRVDPEGGGFLYADIETRVPNQLILSPLIRQVDTRDLDGSISDARFMPDNMTGELTVGGTGTNSRVAISFRTPSSSTPATFPVWIYAQIESTVEVTFAIYTNSGGAPNTLVGSAQTYTPPENTPGWYWHGVSKNPTLSNNTIYWLVVYPTNSAHSFKVGTAATGYATAAAQYNGSAWASISSTYLLFSTGMHRTSTVNNPATGSGFFRLTDDLYLFCDVRVWKYDSTNDQWDLIGQIIDGADSITSITGATVWADKVWFGSGGLTNDKTLTMDTSDAFDYPSLNGNLFAKHGPYLYRAHGNDLYYSADGSAWTGPFEVGSSYVITGMAGMGDSLYVATSEALYRFAPGDVVEGVTTWGSLDPLNGKHLVNYQGALYTVVNGRVLSFTQDGRLMDVWISRDDDVIRGRIGRVWDLCVMNNWLVALLSNPTVEGKPTIWAYQDGAWHHLATLPSATVVIDDTLNYGGYACYYDRETTSLWATTPASVTYRIYVPDYALNPYNDTAAYYMPRGWFEQDRYFGGLQLVNKDFESVTIAADNLSANVHIKVYWQDEGSTAWELLGTIDSDGEELRWSNHSTRPQGKWIKLGLLLCTNDGDETPRIRAVVVKNLPMANDRIRDTVTLSLGKVQAPDGARISETLAQQLANIQSDINSVIPRIYEDPLGVQYEAKIVDYSMTITQFAHENSANVVKELDVTLVIEQVPDGTYSA
jgi:hypothetical protein